MVGCIFLKRRFYAIGEMYSFVFCLFQRLKRAFVISRTKVSPSTDPKDRKSTFADSRLTRLND